ncbi:hypothetical protein KI387_011599, partial [Taxus chinensis]
TGQDSQQKFFTSVLHTHKNNRPLGSVAEFNFALQKGKGIQRNQSISYLQNIGNSVSRDFSAQSSKLYKRSETGSSKAQHNIENA